MNWQKSNISRREGLSLSSEKNGELLYLTIDNEFIVSLVNKNTNPPKGCYFIAYNEQEHFILASLDSDLLIDEIAKSSNTWLWAQNLCLDSAGNITSIDLGYSIIAGFETNVQIILATFGWQTNRSQKELELHRARELSQDIEPRMLDKEVIVGTRLEDLLAKGQRIIDKNRNSFWVATNMPSVKASLKDNVDMLEKYLKTDPINRSAVLELELVTGWSSPIKITVKAGSAKGEFLFRYHSSKSSNDKTLVVNIENPDDAVNGVRKLLKLNKRK